MSENKLDAAEIVRMLAPNERIIQIQTVNSITGDQGLLLLTSHSRLLSPSLEPGAWLVIAAPVLHPDTQL